MAAAPSVPKPLTGGDTGYPAGTAYAEALRDFAAQRWGWDGLAIERTMVVPDVMMGIVEVLRVLTDPGDVVVVCPPVYAPFFAFVTHADRRILEAPLGADRRTDAVALAEAFARARRESNQPVFLMSNPHNPTGTVPTRGELAEVAALARTHGVRVISDETHAPLALPGATFTPYLSVPGAEDAIALTSASKAFNLAGLKAALAIAGPDAAGDLARIPEEVSHGPSHFGVLAHTAAFRDGGAWLDALIACLDENRDLLGRLVAQHLPSVQYVRPEGTFLACLDCRALGLWRCFGGRGAARVPPWTVRRSRYAG